MVQGIPLDKSQVFTNTQEIDAFYEEMDQVLRHVPKQFVINVDETGCADFIGARNEYVIVLATYPDDTIPIQVDRSIKCTKLVGGIVASCEALDPLVIVSRKTMEIESLRGISRVKYTVQIPRKWLQYNLDIRGLDHERPDTMHRGRAH
jgi:hypothetical protein